MGRAAEVAEAYLECFNTRNLDGVRELLHTDYTYTGPDGQTTPGAEAAVAVMEMYAEGFPDARAEIERVHEVSDDCVIVEFVGRGTNTGSFMDGPPTGKPIEVHVCNVLELRDGKILAEREYLNFQTILEQLGLAPAAAPA